jgi:pilus assembly protein CpaE
MTRQADTGQASVELVGGAAVAILAGLVALQLLAAGYAAVMADHAAEAGALALANGREPAAAARSALPGWPAGRTRVRANGGAVEVTLTPPVAFSALRERLSATGRAVVRRPAWDR